MTRTGRQLFQLLKAKLGNREAEALINFVDTRLNENNKEGHENNLRTLATKEDFFLVKADVLGVKADLSDVKKDVFGVKTDVFRLREDLAKAEGRLEVKIAEVKSDIMRWMFAFFVTMMLSIIALYFKH